MGNLLRGLWDRLRRYYRSVSFEPSGAAGDALSDEEADVVRDENRRRWQRKQIAKAIRTADPERPPMTRDDAIDHLAKELCDALARVDCDMTPWDQLDDGDRTVYRIAIQQLIAGNAAELKQALGE